MPFHIVRNDITKVKADAIVNTANPDPIYGSGTDKAVYEAAGASGLLKARKKIGAIGRGEVAVTEAFALDAKYIIHTVGPVWIDGKSGELDTLKSCYRKSLEKARELSCESIAFPLISTGMYGFPKDEALRIALDEISSFLMINEMTVFLVVFDSNAFRLSGKVFDDIRSLIDDAAVHRKSLEEYGTDISQRDGRLILERERMRRERADLSHHSSREDRGHTKNDLASTTPVHKGMEGRSLDSFLRQKGESFHECLFRMIDERGLDDPQVYKRANIDRKHFSKIRCNPDYKPTKKTAIALAIGLELDMDETVRLLSTAGWALSSSSEFDLIISYFINNKRYDIDREINPMLVERNHETLGV